MDLGDLGTVTQGEVRLFPLSFATALASGETVTSLTSSGMALWPQSPVPDANASNLILGTPSVVSPAALLYCGGYNTSGFKAGAVYSAYATVGTSKSQTITAHGQITCDPVVPPNPSSGGAFPNGVTPVTTNATLNAASIYAVETSGLTLTLTAPTYTPTVPMLIMDSYGSGATLSSSVVAWPLGATTTSLPPKGSAWFVWDTTVSKWIPL